MYACMYWIQSMRVQLREWMLHTSNPGFSMNGELWCHAALLHIDCIYLNAISIIDDHYSFSLKSVREKLLQTPRKQQQMSWYDVTMPLEIEKCSFCFFAILWNGVKQQQQQHNSSKTSSIHCFCLSLCWWFKGNVTANCHPVNPQWIQISLRICWLWCGNNRRDSENELEWSIKYAAALKRWGICVPLHTETSVTHFTASNAALLPPPPVFCLFSILKRCL